MFRYILLAVLFCLSLESKSINLDVSSYVFHGTKNYAELYLRVDAKSVQWSIIDGKNEAAVEFLIFITNDKNDIVGYDKFVLKTSNLDSIRDFLDVKRFVLNAGEYTVKVEAFDFSNPDDKIELEQKIYVSPQTSPVFTSDILVLGDVHKDSSESSLVKNGLYMEPLAYNYSSRDDQLINFYLEVYDEKKDLTQDYFVQYALMEGFKSNINTKQLLVKYKKLSKLDIEPLLLNFPTSNIKSGDYHLLINIVDKQKNVVFSKSANFVKSNPEADIAFLESYNDNLENSFAQKLKPEDMDFIIKAHFPIADQSQTATLRELLSSNKIKSQRSFIYQFWKSSNPANPEAAYNGYMEVAKAVDKKFYTNAGYGFQSDRGHIFLKYGKPTNVITVETEVDAPPYEIWYYNTMPRTRQTNVRFLFFNKSLAHNDFHLLHSTCLSERSNPAWETILYGSVPNDRIGNAVDATTVKENFNRNARRYFNEF